MRNIYLVIGLLFSVSVFAFTPKDSTKKSIPDSLRNWKKGGVIGLNFTQASFTNWAAGGQNSVSGQFLFNAFTNYKKGTTTWDNSLDVSYGLLQQGKGTLLRKTDDKLDITSKYGQYAFKKVWYYSALVNFKTQFQPGYNYLGDTAKTKISDWLAPGYGLVALGLDYKPSPKFSIFTAPVTGKFTFVMDQTLADAGAFGVTKATYDASGNRLTPGENLRKEFGGYFRMTYRSDIMPNVNLATKLELFSNYLNKPQNIDVNAEVLLTMKVNKFITASLNMQGIYDDDINIAVDKNNDGVIEASGPRFQFRQVLGIGFSMKF